MENQRVNHAELERLLASLYKFDQDSKYSEHINAILDFASDYSGFSRAFLDRTLSVRSASNYYEATPTNSVKSVPSGPAPQMNTKINYLYRDAENNKVRNSCVINGVLSENQMKTILSCLNEGEYFIPSLVGLPEVKFDEYDSEVDHPWFELGEYSFETTNLHWDVPVTAADLVSAFCSCKDRWEDIYCNVDEYSSERVYVLSGEEMSRSQFLSADIAELDLSVRAYNTLKRAGIYSIGRLISLTDAELMQIRNMGFKCHDEIVSALAAHGERLEPGETSKIKQSNRSINSMIKEASAKKEQGSASDKSGFNGPIR